MKQSKHSIINVINMKQIIILCIGVWLFCSYGFAQSQTKNKELQEFVIDLSSANTKLKGKLLLIKKHDVYGDIMGLVTLFNGCGKR